MIRAQKLGEFGNWRGGRWAKVSYFFRRVEEGTGLEKTVLDRHVLRIRYVYLTFYPAACNVCFVGAMQGCGSPNIPKELGLGLLQLVPLCCAAQQRASGRFCCAAYVRRRFAVRRSAGLRVVRLASV